MNEKMKKPDKQWYKTIWTLGIKEMSWTEATVRQVDFLVQFMELTGSERILDIACGYGRHALEFSRRGFEVVGVDITPEYIADADNSAQVEDLSAVFICDDVRNLRFAEEFDVVLNLADGAIGYLEDDEENLKIFAVISKALKNGGKHFMDICSANHADRYFPKRSWEIGDNAISLPEFIWDKQSRRMLYGGLTIKFGEIVQRPEEVPFHSDIRLYSVDEIEQILPNIGMKLVKKVTNYSDTGYTEDELQLQVYSIKA